jgi:hypothetical protein
MIAMIVPMSDSSHQPGGTMKQLRKILTRRVVDYS